jgi:CarD family transcriptional regulator
LAVFVGAALAEENTMRFHVGDTVVHWSHGMGEVVGVEDREVTGQNQTYYVVKIHELSIWVPNDAHLDKRLRPPTSRDGFEHLFNILRAPAQLLPEDRHQRKLQLHRQLSSGSVEETCRVIRDLTGLEHKKSLNMDDRGVLLRAEASLREEWMHTLRVEPAEVHAALKRLLGVKAA